MQTMVTDALGTSDIFLDFQERLGRLAVSERPVLVVGERGTGKELAAQRLHYLSARWDKPWVTVLCPALSPTLSESELFGHEAGSFTGAHGRRAGYFERADGGTLFLDEVADMPLSLQDKLLRVIEYGVFERVGGVASLRVNVRVVAATNRDLPSLVRQGRFRADLLDRLAFDVLHVPPLRLRGEDKILLARHFAGGMAAELGLMSEGGTTGKTFLTGYAVPGGDDEPLPGSLPGGNGGSPIFGPWFGEEAHRQLESYDWPGNVRELKNVVERTLARRRSLALERLDMDPFISPYGKALAFSGGASSVLSPAPTAGPAPSLPSSPAPGLVSCKTPSLPGKPAPWRDGGLNLRETVQKLESEYLQAALEQSQYRQTDAARLLGLSYHQFRALYRKHQGEARSLLLKE